MTSLKILVVSNNFRGATFSKGIVDLQKWFLQKFKKVDIDVVHTKYVDIPFVPYTASENPILKGIDPTWYDLHVTSIATGNGFYNIVLFVVSESQWHMPNNARGWRADDDQGVVQLHIMGQENASIVSPDGIMHSSFFSWARHEITHAVYMLADQKDNVHEYGDTDAGQKKCLDEITFREPNKVDQISLIQRMLNGLYLVLGILKDNKYPTYENDPDFPIEKPVAPTPAPVKPTRDLLHEFCLAIQEHEGWFPAGSPGYPTGSRSWRNKNPGNVRYVGQKRAIGKDTGNFCIFATYEDGMATLKDQIRLAATGGSKVYRPDMTILQFFEVYAPSFENNTKAYADVVRKKLGVGTDFKIKDLI